MKAARSILMTKHNPIAKWIIRKRKGKPCEELLDSSYSPKSKETQEEVWETHFVFASEQIPKCLIWYG